MKNNNWQNWAALFTIGVFLWCAISAYVKNEEATHDNYLMASQALKDIDTLKNKVNNLDKIITIIKNCGVNHDGHQ